MEVYVVTAFAPGARLNAPQAKHHAHMMTVVSTKEGARKEAVKYLNILISSYSSSAWLANFDNFETVEKEHCRRTGGLEAVFITGPMNVRSGGDDEVATEEKAS